MGMVNETLRRLWGDAHAGADLSAYLDDRLDAPARRRIDRHIAGCARCRDELAAIRQTRDLLRRVQPIRAPRSFALRPSMVPTRIAPSPRLMYRNAAAAMAAMLIAVSAAALVSPPERVVRDAMPVAALAQPAAAPAPAAQAFSAAAPAAQAPAPAPRAAAADLAVREAVAQPATGAAASGAAPTVRANATPLTARPAPAAAAGAPPARVDGAPTIVRAVPAALPRAPEAGVVAQPDTVAGRLAARDGATLPSAAGAAADSAKAAETTAVGTALPAERRIAEVPWAVLIGLAALTAVSSVLALRMR